MRRDSRQQLEAALAKSQAEQQRLRDFLVLICHEMKHPLSTIQVHVELLQRYEEVVDKAAAEVILGKVGQLERLINDLLFVTRLETGQLRLHAEPMDLADLVRAAARQAQVLAPDHQLQVEAPDHPLEGTWDPDRLNQVLHNLLSNAIKYSPSGGTIRVRAQRVRREFQVSVSDQGVGIDSATLPQLFDRFYRADEATVSARGLGLGLYVSRLLVEAHGGRLWAESAGTGQGSTFVLTLPANSP
jgi:signal transduction histidine kinase